MDLFCGLLLYILMASFSFCRQEEKKRKSQSGERQMKDERILNLQRKIAEKAMERKKQAGLLKITPQKANTASRKVWAYIRKRALQSFAVLPALARVLAYWRDSSKSLLPA